MTDDREFSPDEIEDLLGGIDEEAITSMWKHKLAGFTAELDELPDDDDGEYDDNEFTKLLKDRERMRQLPEIQQETVKRWADIEALREHYALFEDFLHDCMTELMGFECSEVQVDIGNFVVDQNNKRIMVQAQRSQAKSTIAAIAAIWCLIHNCKLRVLIISAGSDVAMEIANWAIQIVMNWDILECMRPDRQHGDRASTKAFDIHWQLKGAEKSPSIACIGITANMQGRRADLLIPDDIESSKNSLTDVQRAALIHLSKDFTSICQHGRIVYLGTYQTTDSIYKRLPERGYKIRCWPGRYPTEKEEAAYGDTLAPLIRRRMEADPSLRTGGGIDGTRGKPIDPLLLGEEILTEKELDQGPAYFNLQHMLNAEMADAERFPLKAKNLIVMPFGVDEAPGEITWMPDISRRIKVPGYDYELYRPFSMSQTHYKYEGKNLYVDPAGGGKNGDETVGAVTYFLHGYVFLAEILKIPGGYSPEGFEAMSDLAFRHQVNSIEVEQNFGHGAFAAMWMPILQRHYKEKASRMVPPIDDIHESGQKELRIIDTLEPLMARHRLIIHEDILEYDRESVKKYAFDQRDSYLMMHQLTRISRARNALLHDDAIDAIAGSCRKWIENAAVDEKIRMDQKVTDENVAFFAEWGAQIGSYLDGVMGLSSNRFKRTQTRRPMRFNNKARR